MVKCGSSQPSYSSGGRTTTTEERPSKSEFERLMEKDSVDKHKNAAESLEILFNDEKNSDRVSLLIRNTSNCDIILYIKGKQNYELPIRRKDQNFIAVKKGDYQLESKLCRAIYRSKKSLSSSLTLTLSE